MSIVIMSILASILFFSCLGAILFFPNNTHHIRKNSDENEKLNNGTRMLNNTYEPTETPTYKETNFNKPVDNESNDSNDNNPVDNESNDNNPVDNESNDNNPVDNESNDSNDNNPVDNESNDSNDNNLVDNESNDSNDNNPVDNESNDSNDNNPVDNESNDSNDNNPVDNESNDSNDNNPVDYIDKENEIVLYYYLRAISYQENNSHKYKCKKSVKDLKYEIETPIGYTAKDIITYQNPYFRVDDNDFFSPWCLIEITFTKSYSKYKESSLYLNNEKYISLSSIDNIRSNALYIAKKYFERKSRIVEHINYVPANKVYSNFFYPTFNCDNLENYSSQYNRGNELLVTIFKNPIYVNQNKAVCKIKFQTINTNYPIQSNFKYVYTGLKEIIIVDRMNYYKNDDYTEW